jgi:predicted transcriptional regulator of viral defense system
MERRSVAYGGIGFALVHRLAESGQTTFTMATVRQIAAEVGVTPSYLRFLLHRLVRAGLLHRVKRGTYALVGGLPGGVEAHPFAIAMALVDPCAVSGWSALNHHGLTEQIPQRVTLTTPRRIVTPAMRGAKHAKPSIWEVDGQEYEIVRVIPAHFFGDEEVWVDESKVRIFDRERALLDCFALPRRFGGLGEGLGILEEHLREIDIRLLVAHALRYGKVAVAKRVGYALERAGVPIPIVEPLRALPVQGQRLLDPTKPATGEYNRRWALRENLSARRRS